MMMTKKKKKLKPGFDKHTEKTLDAALAEDVGTGDITTNAIITTGKKGRAELIAKERFVVSGLLVARSIFRKTDDAVKFRKHVKDGDLINKGTVLATVTGPLRGLLTGERVALNFLQRLSGIATLTSRYVKKAGNKHIKILDTRKTTPGMRALERQAVVHGGGTNHRFGLYDAVLIKDNHIAAAGGVGKAIEMVKKKYKKRTPTIEVEVKKLTQIPEALKAGADIIMLDNMNAVRIKKAVRLINRRAMIEVSGGITLDTIGKKTIAGVDFISVGALTHSSPSVDISMEIV